jgi:hypothetical protein
MTDQLTAAERAVTPDCLVELAIAWLHRPLGGLTTAERSEAIDCICLLISQMRHREPKLADIERRRWIERVTVRLCAQCVGMAGYEGAILVQLEQRVTVEMLRYHDWRETIAPVVVRQVKW